jgi:hypothetical protein
VNHFLGPSTLVPREISDDRRLKPRDVCVYAVLATCCWQGSVAHIRNRLITTLAGCAERLLIVMRTMRERVWAAANVQLEIVTIDTDTTVHTLYGQQMGGRKSYNPKNKGKKSYQPMLTFIAETREYVWGELRNGDRPTGKQIGDHIRNVHAALPPGVKQVYGRVDSGFYCREAVAAYEEFNDQFVISSRKTSRLVEQLRQGEWKPSPKTDGDVECESAISRMGGRRNTGSWHCAMRKRARRWMRRLPSSTSVVRHADCRLSRDLRARFTFSRMSAAFAVQMNGLG